MLTEAIVPVRDSISRPPLRCDLPRKQQLPRTQTMWSIRGFLLIPLVLASFALLPMARALDPLPDGSYPGFNTAEGLNALFSLDTRVGINNTAVGSDALFADIDGSNNTAIGFHALQNNTTGDFNTATGIRALQSNTTGPSNTANGEAALFSNTTGSFNTATGSRALFDNTTGYNNTATGGLALFNNTTGNNNTADGLVALAANTTGDNNTANGHAALLDNTTGNNNTANGASALRGDVLERQTGSQNTATGFETLFRNKTGSNNTATGASALYSNTTGFFNAANGIQALYSNTTGYDNTANGANALVSNTIGIKNTANGAFALSSNTTGSSNIALGLSAGTSLTTGDNNIDIGNSGVAGESNTIRIGTSGTQTATYLAGIRGVAIAGAQPVGVNANGQLGVRGSSARFKDAIRPMDKASEAILSLHPVSFRYKKELDPDGIPQFGLVAEQVEKVNPNLVAYDEQGKPYTVRYEAVNAMLLNEFLKEHRRVAALEVKMAQQLSTNADQQKAIQTLAASLKEQASQIQKVSAQVELNMPGPQQVALTIP